MTHPTNTPPTIFSHLYCIIFVHSFWAVFKMLLGGICCRDLATLYWLLKRNKGEIDIVHYHCIITSYGDAVLAYVFSYDKGLQRPKFVPENTNHHCNFMVHINIRLKCWFYTCSGQSAFLTIHKCPYFTLFV